MFSIKINIVYLILTNIFLQIHSLVELPIVEDNNIATAETAIRNTVNNLFTTLRIQNAKQRVKLKQFSSIHNFFVSITLTDCDNLKEIARLIRVDNIDNNTQHFIAQVNEVLNEGDKSKEANDNDNNVYEYIETFIKRLKYLKQLYGVDKSTNDTINVEIFKYIDDNHALFGNVTEESKTSDESDYNVLSDDKIWREQLSGRRIYKGHRTRIKRFPFMASIQFFKKFQCAGSIIENDLVITSASCLQLAYNNRFFRENPSFLSVQIGCDYYEGDGENIPVLEIYFHPSYNPKNLKNNLAIVRLIRRIYFKKSHRRVKMIDIDRNPWPLPINSRKITVVGWGAIDRNNKIYDVFRNKLSYTELDLYLLQDCQEHYSKEFVSEKNFCAGFYSQGGGACNRDAGGPGIVSGILMGVISFGSPICGAIDAPTVFTKLGFYTEWIEQIMEMSVPLTRKETTMAPPKRKYTINFHHSKMRNTPVTTTKWPRIVPGRTSRLDTLRIAQEQGFQDFLANMFGSEEIKDYFADSDSSKARTSAEIVHKHKSKESVEKGQTETTTESTTAKVKPVTNPISKSEVDTKKLFKKYKQENEKSIEITTEAKKQVTIIENASNDDKTLEDHVMSIIDNLDIDNLFDRSNASLTVGEPIANNQEKPITKEHNATASEEHSASTKQENQSTNKEWTEYPTSVSQYILSTTEDPTTMQYREKEDKNEIFVAANVVIGSENEVMGNSSSESSDEMAKDEDEGGLSIELEPKPEKAELTIRDRSDNITKTDVLSESALYDLISHAIEEEAMKLNKNQPYLL